MQISYQSARGFALAAGLLICSGVARADVTPQAFPMLGASMTVDVDPARSGGTNSTITVDVPPHWAVPAHVHTREAEVFVVVRGNFMFYRGSDVIVGKPGSVVYMPANVPHQFVNADATPSELVFTLVPSGLEKMFEEISQRHLVAPRDVGELVALGKDYGITYLPPLAPAAAAPTASP